MPRDLILGTAGHIDHGKTSLVKALTGIDCDRLPEEKARGITIDIGFAHLELGEYRLGIVDVPGHERFIKNMLAGATGIDLVLLVVAADDSVMPQTREHLEILKYLGVRSGVIALTKADLVDETTREVAELEVRELVKDSFLVSAPIIATSAHTGLGIYELKAALIAAAAGIDRQGGELPFRLSIDRAFVMQGHGTVVTGSVASGTLTVGDELEWHRGDGTLERVRVRGLSNHGRQVATVVQGQRAALNLAGVPHEAVSRGQELAAPGVLAPARVITVRLGCSADSRRAIKHRLPCRCHVGTAEVMAIVSLLDCDTIAPGCWGLAQLFLDAPVATVWGQPFVVRDSSGEHTLGGGTVLQPVTRKIRRRHLDVLMQLERLAIGDEDTRVQVAIWLAAFAGATPAELQRAAGISVARASAAIERLHDAGRVVAVALAPHRQVLLHADRVEELEAAILHSIGQFHAENPLLTMLDRQKALARLDHIGNEPLLQAVTDRLITRKLLVGDARRIARADFKPKLSANQRKLKDRIVEAFAAAAFQPPEPKEFASHAGGNAAALNDIFAVAVAEGNLVHVAGDLYLHAEVEAEMRRRLGVRLQQGTGATVAEIRDLLGTTRKYAIPLCEYLDRIGITKRDGDLRVAVG